jgi:NAD(P)-dependent dehydrogenase (short-subunit alcohol dehydrogenase family)
MTARRFAGKRALVTGASRGIGAAVAEELAQLGADVAITARTLEQHPTLPGSLQQTAARLQEHGGKVAVVVADLADDESRAHIVPDACEQLGGTIDILVNNAAAAIYAPLSDFPVRRRRIVFEVDFHAPLDLAQAVIPAMRDKGEGWIVNVSSRTAQLFPGPPYRLGATGTTITIYGAAKAALNRLTNGLAAELDGTGIRVNSVEPRAAVLTEGADALVGDILTAEMIEPMETMVAATLLLCDCDPSTTGLIAVSTELLAEWEAKCSD